MRNLYDLRVGDIVIREMDADDGVERHLGEVLSIRARIQYPNVGYPWREWWDVSTALLSNFPPDAAAAHRLRSASAAEIKRLGLGD